MAAPHISQSIRKLIYFVVAVLLFSVFFLHKEDFTLKELVSTRTGQHIQDSQEHFLTPGDKEVHRVSPAAELTPSPPKVVPAPPPEPVVFSLIMWSETSATEGALLIKSIIMYNTHPTDIHIICDDEAEAYLRGRLQLLTRPRHQVRVWYYKPTWQAMLDRVDREGSLKTDHSAGLPGLMKLFIHELLPNNVTKSIFVDTDAFFLVDPTLLWNVFDTLKPQTSIVMSSHPDQTVEEWHNASRICSCVMLLDLQKLRDSRLMDSNVYAKIDPENPGVALGTTAFRAMYGEPSGEGGRYDNVRLGDQGYWWAIVDYHKELWEPLSYDFEVTSCLMNAYSTGLQGDEFITEEDEGKRQTNVKGTPQEGITILPKLLHFNCLHGSPVYMDWPGWEDPNELVNWLWGPAMKYHHRYKWIWLNQGDREKPKHVGVEQYSLDNVMFADELLLKAHTHNSKNPHA